MPAAVRRGALRGLGKFLSTLAGGYESERLRRQQIEDEQRQARMRMGEMTLRDWLEQQSPKYQEELKQTRAQAGASEAAAAASRATTAKTEQEAETYRNLTPEQRAELAMEPATKARAAVLGAETEKARLPIYERSIAAQEKQAQIDASREARLNLGGRQNKPESFVDAEDQWKAQLAILDARGKYQELYQLAVGLGLSADAKEPWYSSAYKTWLDTTYKPWKGGIIKGAGPSPEDIEAGLLDLGSVPATSITGVPSAGAFRQPTIVPTIALPLGAGPSPASPVVPAVATTPPPVAENTAGLSPEEIDYIREEARRAGISFNDARAQLEAKLQ